MTLKQSLPYGLGILVILAFMYLFGASTQRVGATAGFLPGTVASTTNITVTSTATSAIATSTCTSRIVSTGGSAVMLTFSDYSNQTPTGSFGFLQAASTTVAYDAGLYGCGLFKIFSFTSQLITVSDVR